MYRYTLIITSVLVAIILEHGATVTPIYYATTKTYIIETNVYSIKEDKIR